ncbi:MAG: DUF7417 domain-containing protein [Promethearchaeota archaeon]
MKNHINIFDKIIQFEEEGMNEQETISFFQELKDTGLVWHLQGFYQRMLHKLIEADLIK